MFDPSDDDRQSEDCNSEEHRADPAFVGAPCHSVTHYTDDRGAGIAGPLELASWRRDQNRVLTTSAMTAAAASWIADTI
jgi:hypothetical protein